MVEALAERDRIGDRAFDEGRTPTREEWGRVRELQACYEGYCEFLNRFFMEPQEPDQGFEFLLH